jgi:tetratricopeptide (TPR) repeat protein
LWKQGATLLEQAERQLGSDGDSGLHRELAAALANLRFLAKLDRIRQEKVTIVEMVVNGVIRKEVDRTRANPMYAEAFREFGLDLLTGEVEELAARLHSSPIHEELIAALDDWALDETDSQRRNRLDQIGAAATGESWRQDLPRLRNDPSALKALTERLKRSGGSPAHVIRLARQLDDNGLDSLPLLEAGSRFHPTSFVLHYERGARYWSRKQYDAVVGACHAALALQPNSFAVWANMGDALQARHDLEGAIACYHTALRIDPNFSRIHNCLGCALRTGKNLDGAIACFRRSIQLDPKSPHAHTNLGAALHDRRDLDGAIACFHTAIKLDPNLIAAHVNLGIVLNDKGDPKGAIASFRRAIELDPKYAPVHYFLGNVLKASGDAEAAIACYRSAVGIDPNYADAFTNLGAALHEKHDLKGAIECLRSAVRLNPKLLQNHLNLGLALFETNNFGEAGACFRSALKIDPSSSQAHYNLGSVLKAGGDREGAIAHFRTAIRLDPKFAQAHTNLGAALHEKGELAEAIACFRTAIKLDPKLFQAHFNLGIVLTDKKDLEGSIAAFRKARELSPDNPHATVNLRRNERWLELSPKMRAILAGREKARDAGESLELAQFCGQFHKRYLAALRFYRDAVAADAKLAEDMQKQYRYDAACWAALAAAGQGEDARNLSREKVAELLRQALDWLRDDLAAYTQSAPKADAPMRQTIAGRLRHWEQDSDLSGVRDKDHLIALPDGEREKWAKLWKDVEQLRKQLVDMK